MNPTNINPPLHDDDSTKLLWITDVDLNKLHSIDANRKLAVQLKSQSYIKVC